MRVAIQDPITGTPLRINTDGTLAIATSAAPAPDGEPQAGNLDAATETTLAAILAELASKYEGQDITVTVSNFPSSNALTDAQLRATPLPVSGTFYPATQPVSGTISVSNFPSSTGLTDTQLRATPVPVSGSVSISNQPGTQAVSGTVGVNNFPATQAVSGSVSVSNFPATQPVSGSLSVSNFPATQPVSGTLTVANPYVPSTLAVTATGAAAAAVTLTLPAVASSFHYLTRLEICLYSTAARAGTATPIIVTSTNLPGSPAFTFPSAGAIGTMETRILELDAAPLKSSSVNTPTTIVCPVVTAGIWRLNATYFTGA